MARCGWRLRTWGAATRAWLRAAPSRRRGERLPIVGALRASFCTSMSARCAKVPCKLCQVRLPPGWICKEMQNAKVAVQALGAAGVEGSGRHGWKEVRRSGQKEGMGGRTDFTSRPRSQKGAHGTTSNSALGRASGWQAAQLKPASPAPDHRQAGSDRFLVPAPAPACPPRLVVHRPGGCLTWCTAVGGARWGAGWSRRLPSCRRLVLDGPAARGLSTRCGPPDHGQQATRSPTPRWLPV